MAPNGYKKISSTNNSAEKVGFVSFLLFQWMNDVMKTGSKRTLEEGDFVPLSNENTSQSATELLDKKWKEEIANSIRKKKTPKLWKSVLKMISLREAVFVVCCDVLFAIGSLLSPLLIGHLIFMLMSHETHQNNILHGCVLATAMAVTTLVGTLGMQHSGYAAEIMGIRLSNAVKGLVYRKVSTRRVTVSSPAFSIICAAFTFSHPVAFARVSCRRRCFEEDCGRVRAGLDWVG